MTAPLYAGALSALLALSIVLGLFVGPRLREARETQEREAVLAAAVARLQRLCAPAVATVYEAPISEGEAERMQRLVAFGAAMDVLRRRTSWRGGMREVRS